MLAQTETAERIRELLTRNLQKVFGEGDDERRRAAIDASRQSAFARATG